MNDIVLNSLMIGQIVVSVLLIVSILIQQRAGGLGKMFGGGGGEVFRTKRGFEKFLSTFTVVLGVIFAVLSFLIVKFTN